MEVRYLCKKEFDLDETVILNRGSIIKIDFADNNFPTIREYAASYNDIHRCQVLIPFKKLNEYFTLYDDIDYIDTKTAMFLFETKFAGKKSEKKLLYELQHYINKRLKFLRQCETEDTHQEQEKTETLHTTSQI